MHAMDFGPAPTEPVEPPKEPEATQEPPREEKPPSGQPDAKEGQSGEPAKDETPVETPVEEPPKPKKAKKVEDDEDEDESPSIDLDAIREAVREGVAAKAEPAKTADPKPEEPKLSPSRQDTLEAAKFMEQNNDEYRGTGLSEQLKRFWKAEDEYKSKWLKENPGKRFRSDDDIHNEFYEGSPMPDYSADDLEDAKVLRRQQIEQQREEAHRQELARIKFESQSKQHEEEIRNTASQAMADLYINAPDNVKAALTVDGKVVINAATIEKLEVEEPVYAERLKHHGNIVGQMVEELERLSRFPEHVKYDPNNPLHRHLTAFVDNLEQHLLSLPKSQTTVDGKQFIAQEDYIRRSQQISASDAPITQKRAQLKALNDKFYFPDANVIRRHLIHAATNKAIEEAKEIEARLSKSPKYARPSATAPSGNGEPAPAPKAGDGRDVRPPSPSVSTTDRTNAGGADTKNVKSGADQFEAAMWG